MNNYSKMGEKMKKVFIDGQYGTTGLRIFDRLSARKDIELITLDENSKKDLECRKKALNSADVAFLCLPDKAAEEAVALIENEKTVVIDTSTAHRTLENWLYAFPEIGSEIKEKLKTAKRIAVPGCHASGFIALVSPLVKSGIISEKELLTCHSVTGYSGGGKKMIAEYESDEISELLSAPRQYGLSQNHKHLKEMKKFSLLENAPIFCPVVAPFYSGMCVTVPLFKEQLQCGDINKIKEIYEEKYSGSIVRYLPESDENGFLSAAKFSGKDSMNISVFGNEDRILLTARYDNLGKGASGAALEALNIVIGADETEGLEL